MPFSPGLVYLWRIFPTLLVAPSVVLAFDLLSGLFLASYLPIYTTLIPLLLLSWPLHFVLFVQRRDYLKRREAQKRGARLLPVIKHRIPGNYETLHQLQQEKVDHYLGDLFFRSLETYGNTFNPRVMFEDRVVTTEPGYIKLVISTNFSNHIQSTHNQEALHNLLGVGVLNSHGDLWKFHRGMTRPFFSKDRIAHLHIFERYADHAISVMKERLRAGYAIDWQDLTSRFTLDSGTEFLFGQDLRMLDEALPYPPTSVADKFTPDTSTNRANRFARAFLAAMATTAQRQLRGEFWRLFELWEDKVEPHMKIVREFVDPIVERALEDKKQREKRELNHVGDEDETLLSHLVNLTDDLKIIRDETLNVLLASRDTTACTLTFGVYMLAEHPDVLSRLREEILSRVGPSNSPTLEDIREMKYLRAFINEVLRLYPPVPFNLRMSIEPVVWPSMTPGEQDIYIAGGTPIAYSVFHMQRRKDLWGPDALEFDPDRFLDERMQKYLVPNPFIFIPFNAGPRICLGQQFAYNEISYMLIRLLQQISTIELVQDVAPDSKPPPKYMTSSGHNGKEKVWLKSHVTLYAHNGLWVRMGEAPRSDTA